MSKLASALTKTTLVSESWKNFYDSLVSDVVGESVTDSHNITHNLTKATSSFPDTQIDKKSTYPLLVISSPTFSSESFTLDKEQLTGEITIEIWTTNSEAADKFMNKIMNSIETRKDDLADNKIHKITMASMDSDSAQRDQIKVHVRSVTYSFITRYTKTRSH